MSRAGYITLFWSGAVSPLTVTPSLFFLILHDHTDTWHRHSQSHSISHCHSVTTFSFCISFETTLLARIPCVMLECNGQLDLGMFRKQFGRHESVAGNRRSPGLQTKHSQISSDYWPTSLSHEYHKFLVANTNSTGYSVELHLRH